MLNKQKLQLAAWLLVLVNVIFIFILTFQDVQGTTQLSAGTRDMVVEITNTPVEVDGHSWWYINIRKLAHVPEYFALGITTTFAWYVTSKKWLAVKAFLFSATVSFADQLVKGMLPTREYDTTDLLFDFIGYSAGILLVMMGIREIRHLRKASI